MEKRDTISDRNRTRSLLPAETEAHYETGYERDRLLGGTSRIEFARTQQILRRVLPAPPARVVDVGGGAGAYAAWLARDGYEVCLLDAEVIAAHPYEARGYPGVFDADGAVADV